MSVDEIVAYLVGSRALTHPDDIAYHRAEVELIVSLYEAPHRWNEADTSQSGE